MKALLKILLFILLINSDLMCQIKKLGLADQPKILTLKFMQVISNDVKENMYGIYVTTKITDLTFSPILSLKSVQGGYLIFVKNNSEYLEIASPDYENFKLVYSDYGINFSKNNFWQIQLEETSDKTLTLVTVNINNAADYNLIIDGLNVEKNKNHFLLSKARHIFTIKNNLTLINDTVNVSDSVNNFTYNLSNIGKEETKIKTIPAGADIFINGKEEGKSDLLTYLSSGKHKIKIVLPGYYDIEEYIYVKNKIINSFTYYLTKSLASLQINTEPPDVNVYINGKLTTEKLIELEAIGKYIIEVERPNYTKIIDSLIINAGDRIQRNYNLLLSTGYLQLTVTPSNANVKIDGITKDIKAIIILEEGTHKLEIEKEGYDSFQELINITKNQTLKKVVNLLPYYGSLYLKVTPSNYKIRLIRDNKIIKEVYNKSIIDSLIAGKYFIEISSEPKYYSYNDTVLIRKNTTESLNVRLRLKDIYDIKIVNVIAEGDVIKNVKFQKKDYYYNVYYDFESDNDTRYEIKLFLVDSSPREKKTIPLKYVTGDIGELKYLGKNKVLQWNFIDEYPEGIDNDNLYLLLKAERIRSGIPWYIYSAIIGSAVTYIIFKGKLQSDRSSNTQLPLPPKRPSY